MRIHVVSIFAALGILGVMLELLRRRQLREKYAVLWLFVGVVAIVLAAYPPLLDSVAHGLRVADPVNLLLFMAAVFLVAVCMHLSWESSRLEEETRALAEEVALMRHDLDLVATGSPPPGSRPSVAERA